MLILPFFQFISRWRSIRCLLRRSIGFIFAGSVFAVAAMHLPSAWYNFPGGWFYIALPHSNSDERWWKTHRQTGTLDDSDWFLQWSLSSTSFWISRLLVLRILQFWCMDASMESGHVQNLLNAMSIQRPISWEWSEANVRCIHDQICLLNARWRYIVRVALFRENGSQLATIYWTHSRHKQQCQYEWFG